MGNLLNRRREMMQASSEPELGEEYYNFGTVIIKNGASSSISVGYISYSSPTTFYMNGASSISAGATKSYSNVLTDGTHIWFDAGSATYVKKVRWNGAAVSYKKTSTNWMLTIPDNFDNTIPIEFYTS